MPLEYGTYLVETSRDSSLRHESETEHYANFNVEIRIKNAGMVNPASHNVEPKIPIPATCSGIACGDCEASIETTSCSVSIQTSTIDFVIATTAISDAGPCGLGYPRGVVPGFTNITNEYNRFEVDYAITTAPQRNVVFSCNATDVTAIVVDAISFYGAFGR